MAASIFLKYWGARVSLVRSYGPDMILANVRLPEGFDPFIFFKNEN